MHPDRLCCEQLMAFVEYEKIDIQKSQDRKKLAVFISPFAKDTAEQCVEELAEFLHIDPRLPEEKKQYQAIEPIQIDPAWNREEIIAYLESIRDKNSTVDLAFYAYRDMTRCDWRPFIKAAVERNPVSIEVHTDDSIEQVYSQLSSLPNESIYEGPRLAQPDEVANYKTGDGLEKAFTLANILHRRMPEATVDITIDKNNVIVRADKDYTFNSFKQLTRQIRIEGGNYEVRGK
jgi:hypothetical protein